MSHQTFVQFLHSLQHERPSLASRVARNATYAEIAEYLKTHLAHQNDHISWLAANIVKLVHDRQEYLDNEFIKKQFTKEGRRKLHAYDEVIDEYISTLAYASQFYSDVRTISLRGGYRRQKKRMTKRRASVTNSTRLRRARGAAGVRSAGSSAR